MACSSSVFGCRKTGFRIHFSAAACLLLAPLAPPLKARLPAEFAFVLFIADPLDSRGRGRTDAMILRRPNRFLLLRPELSRTFTCFPSILFFRPPPVDIDQSDYGAVDFVLGGTIRPHPQRVL